MVGDQASDLEAARAANCEAILIDPDGSGASAIGIDSCTIVASLSEAANLICVD
jgi:phosphoglycolate phosphatase-like HAD superfamily hydrolase